VVIILNAGDDGLKDIGYHGRFTLVLAQVLI
jgi:hypothetical protein